MGQIEIPIANCFTTKIAPREKSVSGSVLLILHRFLCLQQSSASATVVPNRQKRDPTSLVQAERQAFNWSPVNKIEHSQKRVPIHYKGRITVLRLFP
jgi:hypothetical protein